jgi:hypothetical protein
LKESCTIEKEEGRKTENGRKKDKERGNKKKTADSNR